MTDEGLDLVNPESMFISDGVGSMRSLNKSQVPDRRQAMDRLNSLINRNIRHGSLMPKRTSKLLKEDSFKKKDVQIEFSDSTPTPMPRHLRKTLSQVSREQNLQF